MLARHHQAAMVPCLVLLLPHKLWQCGFNFNRSCLGQRCDDETFFVVLLSDVDPSVLLGLEKILSNHALALGNDRGFDVEELRDMVVSALVRDRRGCVAKTGHLYCVKGLSLVFST